MKCVNRNAQHIPVPNEVHYIYMARAYSCSTIVTRSNCRNCLVVSRPKAFLKKTKIYIMEREDLSRYVGVMARCRARFDNAKLNEKQL